jgi:hypothetical protein
MMAEPRLTRRSSVWPQILASARKAREDDDDEEELDEEMDEEPDAILAFSRVESSGAKICLWNSK